MLRLILPVLFPSWRFFASVGPSPRLEYGLWDSSLEPEHWQEFRPRPPQLTWRQCLGRLFYNAQWNETLFIMSCCEHLLDEANIVRVDEIFNRLFRALATGEIVAPPRVSHISFRIQILQREDKQIQRAVAFIAGPRPMKSAPIERPAP